MPDLRDVLVLLAQHAMNTADYLLENGGGSDIALIIGGDRYTYADLSKSCARLALELQQIGVRPGDRVGILGNNSLFWISAYLAAFKLFAVAVPLATILVPDELTTMIRFAGCKALCVERRIYQRLVSAVPLDCVPVFEDTLQSAGEQTWTLDSTAFDDYSDAALMFTSGTTARPRAVRVTHQNIQANTESILRYLNLTPADRMMAILPFYYCFGASLLHTHLRAGASLVLSNSFVYPEMVLDQIEETSCTGFAGVPSTYQTLLRNSSFPKRQMKTLRKVQQAGGQFQNILIQELVQAVPEGQVYLMYGQTEATARLSYLPPELLETKLGSIGKGIPGVTLRVIGEDGNEVKPGEVGEIYAWGENISPGYLDDPQVNSQRFAGGALHTADLATVDEDGYIYVVDRKSDFIKSYGFRVSSQKIEGCILELPEVVSTAVIGIPDLVRGEAIEAFVVRKAGSGITSKDIICHCAKRLAHQMVPKEAVFVDSLPLNTSGKVMKTELRKMAQAEI